VNRLDKIISRNLRSNEVLVSNVDSILYSIKTDSSVDRTSEDVPKPLTFVNVHRSRNDFSVVHRRLIALVDPGSTHSIVKRSFVDGVRNKKMQKNNVSYNVAGGKFYTKYEAKLGLSLPEFSSQTNVVRHRFAIDDSDGEGIGYDLIIGQDLCKIMGIDLHYSDCTIQMNAGRSIAMKSSNFPIRQSAISSREIKQVVIARSEEPKVTAEATDRIVKILDSDYHKADLRKVAAKATQLNKRQQLSLLRLLQKYEALFDGTLGKWNTDPVNIELREDAKPVSSRYYPVPKITKKPLEKSYFI
jgi:hypothetical protein